MKQDYLYRNDKLFVIDAIDNSNNDLIIVTSSGEIRLGHERSNRRIDMIMLDCDYFYEDSIPVSLLEIILSKESITKGLIAHYQKVPSVMLKYLSAADLEVIKDVLNYYNIVTQPKKYILINYSKSDNEDFIKIYGVSDKEAVNIIEQEYEDENYYGFFNINLKDRDYGFSLIVTNDERLSSKYCDILLLKEFFKLKNKNLEEEIFVQFEKVWNEEISGADKFWTNDKIEDYDETYYTDSYSKWKTY